MTDNDLITWLRAQLDRQERAGRKAIEFGTRDSIHNGTRLLAEVEAKRSILGVLAAGVAACGLDEILAWLVVRHLATPYADRPDYREEWRP